MKGHRDMAFHKLTPDDLPRLVSGDNDIDYLVRQLAAALAPAPYHPGEGESCKTCKHQYGGKCHSKKALLHDVIQYCQNYYRREATA